MDFLDKIWEDVKQHPIIAAALAGAAAKLGLRNGRRVARLTSNYKAMKRAPVSYGVVTSATSPVYGKINASSSNSGILRTVEDLDVAKAEAAAYPDAEVVQYIEKPIAEMVTAPPVRIFGGGEYADPKLNQLYHVSEAGYDPRNLPFVWDPINNDRILLANDGSYAFADNLMGLETNGQRPAVEILPWLDDDYLPISNTDPSAFDVDLERASGWNPNTRSDVDFLRAVSGSNLNGGVVIPDVFPMVRSEVDTRKNPVIERLYTSPRSVWRAPLGESRWKTALRTVPFNWARDILGPIVFGGLGAGAAGLGYGAYKLYDYLTGK